MSQKSCIIFPTTPKKSLKFECSGKLRYRVMEYGGEGLETAQRFPFALWATVLCFIATNDDQTQLQKWLPTILRMNTTAKS